MGGILYVMRTGCHTPSKAVRPVMASRHPLEGVLTATCGPLRGHRGAGCPWNAVPKEYGSGKTVHRYFQKWTRAGVFKQMWQAGLAEYDDLVGILWTWQAADGVKVAL